MVDRGMIDAILEATPDIMIILNRDGTVWYCTEKVRGLGWTAAELLGMPFEVLIPESMRAEALTTIANDLKSHGIADIMIPIERKGMAPVDLSLRWIEFSGADGVEGAVILLSAAPAAALTSEYLAIFRHLLTSTTMDDFLDKVLDEVKGLPIDSVTTYEYSPELNQFSVVHSWVRGKDVRRDGLIIPHNYTHLSGVVGTGRPIIRPSFDREEHLFPIDTLHRDDGIRADASYPLVVRGKVRGAVTFGSFQSDHFTPALRNTMELLADVISGFLEKEAETRRIEARSAMYRVLAESVDQPMASVARDGTIRFANPAFRDLIGGGKGIIFELVTGDVREAFFELIEATADGGRDSREVNIDGRPHLIETIGQVEGEVIHLIVHDLKGEREIETFRTVVENLPHPVIVIDDGGWITHTSEAARKLFGRLEGKPLEDALPDLADLMGREPAIGEITLDMRRYRVQCQRAVGHHVCAIIDVTEWVARDDAVGRELDRLRSTFEALSRTGLALIRTSGDRIVEWPEEATALTGIEAKGEDVFEALHIDREAAEEALREGVFTAVVEIPGGDGSVHTQVHMVRWRGDILAVLQDHTAEKRLQERLREYARGLEERIEEIEGEREDVTRRTGTALDALKGAIEEAAAAFRDIVYLR
ncbi:MAG TPA: PAS domain-containing protein, partial [Thermoplasmata archaeon]|nr:PAS domain-containing protein [Thermoplasmata archaeon]